MIQEIVCIIEGRGEERAAPVLVRRIAEVLNQYPKVHRVRGARSGLVTDKLGDQVKIALALSANARILLLFDADDARACELGPTCVTLLQKFAPHKRSGTVLAVREFENWFIAGIEGLWGKRGIPRGLVPPPAVESIRDAKGWLSRHMEPGFAYSPANDQAAFASLFDMNEARRRAPSFDKCWREIEKLLAAD